MFFRFVHFFQKDGQCEMKINKITNIILELVLQKQVPDCTGIVLVIKRLVVFLLNVLLMTELLSNGRFEITALKKHCL